MVVSTLLYIITAVVGVESYKFNVLGGLNPVNLVEITVVIGTFLFTLPVSLRNIYLSYKDGTGKQRPFLEAIQPLASLIMLLVLSWTWALFSNNDIINADPRCFYYMSGTLYSNVVARLLVAQVTGTKCEPLIPGLYLLAVSVATSLTTPGLPKMSELLMLYILAILFTAFHLHYAACVLIQMSHHLKLTFFTISPKEKTLSQNGLTKNNHRIKITLDGSEDKDRLLNTNPNDIDNICIKCPER